MKLSLAPRSFVLPVLLSGSLLSGCGTFYKDSSPDVVYSRDSASARTLQVPPDLTDVSDGEQFVVPGNQGGAVTRDTLLPAFENVRFERDGKSAWLAFDATPEDLWPRLLAFARHERYRIAATEPTAGTLYTQWRPASAVRENSLLSGLIGSEKFSRLGFRLERAGNKGSRLFVRQQTGNEALATSGDALPWPRTATDADANGALLARLLVFLGVEEQRARGVLDGEQAAAVIDNAAVSSSAAGSVLIVNRGFEPAFRAMSSAVTSLDHQLISSDDGVGRIEYLDDGESVIVTLVPVHVGAVRITLSDENGRRLPSTRERDMLESLRDAMLA